MGLRIIDVRNLALTIIDLRIIALPITSANHCASSLHVNDPQNHGAPEDHHMTRRNQLL